MHSPKNNLSTVYRLLVASFPVLGFAMTASGFDSEFTSSNEGWTIISHNNSQNPTNPSGISSQDANPAVNNGQLVVNDLDNEWTYILAPSSFHGDWSQFSEVGIDLTTDNLTTVFNLRLVITDGTDRAEYEFPINGTPPSSDLTLSAPINESLWTVTGTWSTLLQNVSDFFIRIDLNDDVGGEINLVDRVRLTASTLNLTIEDAVLLEFFAKDGFIYQLESSLDGQDWKSFGDPILGDDSLKDKGVRTEAGTTRLFRVQETPVGVGP